MGAAPKGSAALFFKKAIRLERCAISGIGRRLFQTRWSNEIAPRPRAIINVSSDNHKICSANRAGHHKKLNEHCHSESRET